MAAAGPFLFVALVSCAATSRAGAPPAPQLAVYSGRLAPVRVSDEDAAPKRFEIRWFVPAAADHSTKALFVTQENLYALPWYLRAGFAAPSGPGRPSVGYEIDGRAHLVKLPRLVVAKLPKESADDLSHTVSRETIDDRECRVFKGTLPSGRSATLAVDAKTAQLVRYQGVVVIGRGDRLELTLELKKSTRPDQEALGRLARLSERLETALPDRSSLGDPFAFQLPNKTIEAIDADRRAWTAMSRKTLFESFVDDILRDVDRRQKSDQQMREFAKDMIGAPAPRLPQTGIDGQPVDPARLKGKTVVLHFWSYDIEPLSAPFGQVGPLDFLARQREGDGITVLGIAVDPRFGKPAEAPAAVQSARQFAEFMNLSYRVCQDDGAILKQFGDPRTRGGELPLWVVVDPKGDVRFYRPGLFELKDPNDGLPELEQTITEVQ